MADRTDYIMYKGYEIQQRRRYNKKLDGFITYGFYIGNKYYSNLTDAQLAIDEIVRERSENQFWMEYAESYYG